MKVVIKEMLSDYKRTYKSSIDSKTYRKVLTKIFRSIEAIIINKGYFKFPEKLGFLTVIRQDYIPRFKDGKIIGLPPIHFNKTMKLWEEDEQSKKDKILIRHTDTIFYILKYSNKGCIFPNRGNYKFIVRRFLKNSVNAYNNGNKPYHIKSTN